MHIPLFKRKGRDASFANVDLFISCESKYFPSMVEIHLENDPSFLSEQWIEYGIGLFIIFVRYFVRIRTVGFRGFQGDDYMAILV